MKDKKIIIEFMCSPVVHSVEHCLKQKKPEQVQMHGASWRRDMTMAATDYYRDIPLELLVCFACCSYM